MSDTEPLYQSNSAIYRSGLVTTIQGENIDTYTNEAIKAAEDSNVSGSNVHVHVQTAVYGRRWYIIMMFSLVAMTQSSVWNTWGPIEDSAQAVYGWSDFQLGMFPNWGNVAYILTAFIAAWVLDEKGLRVGVVGCAGLIAIATGLRCLPLETTAYTWLANVASIVNGIAGTVPFSGPPVVSAAWFPVHERTIATAIATVFSYLGTASSFLIGPMMVKEYMYFPKLNKSQLIPNTTANTLFDVPIHTVPNDPFHINDQKNSIQLLMYVEFGWAVLLFLLVLIYYPAHPPSPPSQSAAVERYSFKKGLLQLCRNRQFWLALLAYAAPVGVYGVWGTVLDANLDPVGIQQDEAGWLGFYSTIGGAICGVLIAWLADRGLFRGHLKHILFVLLFGALCASLWLALLCEKIIPFSTAQLYASCILGGMLLNGTVPLFYELTVEACYPVAEGVTCGMLTLFNNIFGSLFLSILFDKSIGTSWMNWVVVGTIALSFPFLILFKEKHARSALDTTVDVSHPTGKEI